MNIRVKEETTVDSSVSASDELNSSAQGVAERHHGRLIFAVLLLTLVTVGSWHLLDPATLPIRHVRIEGNFEHLSPATLQSMVSSVINGGFFNLNVMGIKEVLLSDPWVKWVVVQRVWPDGLNVHVKEQRAIAHWNQDHLMNDSATIFTPKTAVSIEGLPYLYGPDDTHELVFERYHEIENALGSTASIESLVLSERRAWQFQLHDGPLVILGRSDVDGRIGRFTGAVISSLRDELTGVKRIDLRYPNGFAIQWLDNFHNTIESGFENNG